MAELTIAVLLVTVLLGAWLAVVVLRPGLARPGWGLRLGHGGLGGVGLGWSGCFCLRVKAGGDAVDLEAACLLGLGLVLGLVLWRKAGALGASRGMVLALHAMIGGTGR